MADDDTREVTHEVLGLTAPAAYWKALGYTVYSNAGIKAGSTDALLIEGIAAGGGAGPEVIAWALTERNRRSEERDRNQAARQLADAMIQSGRQEALAMIIGSLSEKTQFAVRQQLRERGVVLPS